MDDTNLCIYQETTNRNKNLLAHGKNFLFIFLNDEW